MIQVILIDSETGRSATADIPAEHAPALRSAMNEIRNELGERVSGSHCFAKEHSLTAAVSAIGRVAAAVNHVILYEDPTYERCREGQQ